MGLFGSGDDKLTANEKDAASFLASATGRYGPLTRHQVEGYAAEAEAKGGRGGRNLAHGLKKVADEMEPGEVVTGSSVSWWRR